MSRDETWFCQPREFTIRNLAYYCFVFGALVGFIVELTSFPVWIVALTVIVADFRFYFFLRVRQKIREKLTAVVGDVLRIIVVEGLLLGKTFGYVPQYALGSGPFDLPHWMSNLCVLVLMFCFGALFMWLLYFYPFRISDTKLRAELTDGWETPVRKLFR
jgi:hypothetical protein